MTLQACGGGARGPGGRRWVGLGVTLLQLACPAGHVDSFKFMHTNGPAVSGLVPMVSSCQVLYIDLRVLGDLHSGAHIKGFWNPRYGLSPWISEPAKLRRAETNHQSLIALGRRLQQRPRKLF